MAELANNPAANLFDSLFDNARQAFTARLDSERQRADLALAQAFAAATQQEQTEQMPPETRPGFSLPQDMLIIAGIIVAGLFAVALVR